MKTADRQRICEIKFLADGSPAQVANSLAKLLIVSLDVLMQQMTPQSHYDFSLRAIMNILKYTSSLKNVQGHDETFILRMANPILIRTSASNVADVSMPAAIRPS